MSAALDDFRLGEVYFAMFSRRYLRSSTQFPRYYLNTTAKSLLWLNINAGVMLKDYVVDIIYTEMQYNIDHQSI